MKANLLVGSQEPGDHVTLRYIDGKEQPRFPVPSIVCQVVWFPKGNPFVEPEVPYVNLLGYNGRQGIYGPGYYTVRRYFCY